jgi:flagellar basal body-associated protein FliL
MDMSVNKNNKIIFGRIIKMNKRLTLILILILIGLFTLGIVSCSAWLAEKPADATVTISPVKIQGDSIQSTKLIYDVEIVNNGRNDIKVTSFDAVISFFGGAYELPIKDIINLKVEAKTTETFVFKKEINVEEIMDSIENFENIESSELKFEGKLRLANMDDVENFSTFSVVDNLPIAKAPIVKGAEIKLDEADYHFAMFAFEIVIENVNPFEIELVPDRKSVV